LELELEFRQFKQLHFPSKNCLAIRINPLNGNPGDIGSVHAARTEHIPEMAEITEFYKGKLVLLLFKSWGEQKNVYNILIE